MASVNMDFSSQISSGINKAFTGPAKEILGKKQNDTAENFKQEQQIEAVKKNSALLSKFFDKTNEGTRGGGAAGSQVEEDLNELKSGRFAGIFLRAKDTIKSLKDTGTEIFGKKEELQKAAGLKQPSSELLPSLGESGSSVSAGLGSSDIPGVAPVGKPQERERFAGLKAIQEETANKLAASKSETMDYFNKTLFGDGEEKLAQVRGRTGTADTPFGMSGKSGTQQMKFAGRTVFEKAEFKKVEISKTAQAGMFGAAAGKGFGSGSGGQAAQPAEGAADSAGKFGLFVGGVAAAGLKLMSSLAGMYQQAMESQDRTLDSMGYVGSGGALTSNAEMAQIGLSRAKILGGEGRDQLSNQLGVRFGLRQGIGGSEGAEIFAKMNKYGGFKENAESFKEILAQGIKGGFEGQRQSEMFQKIAGMNEESARAGYGKGNSLDTAAVIAAISAKGIGADNSLTMTENINKKFQEEGGLFNSIVLSQKLQEYQNQGMSSSEAFLKAMSYAQDPSNMRENMSMVSSALKETGMGDADIGVILQKQQVATAKQLSDVNDKTGSYNILDMSAQDFKASTKDYQKATAESSKTMKVGQSYRATKNAIDNLVVGSAVAQTAYMTQLKITTGMIDFLGNADKGISGYLNGNSEAWNKGKDGWEGAKNVLEYNKDLIVDKLKKDNYADLGRQSEMKNKGFMDRLGGAFKASIGLGDKDKYAAMGILEENKGKPMSEETGQLLATYLKDMADAQKVTVEIAAKQVGLSNEQLKAISKKAKSPFGK